MVWVVTFKLNTNDYCEFVIITILQFHHGLAIHYDAPFNIKEFSIVVPFSYDSTHFNKSHAFIVKATRRHFLPLRLFENHAGRDRPLVENMVISLRNHYYRFYDHLSVFLTNNLNFSCVFN